MLTDGRVGTPLNSIIHASTPDKARLTTLKTILTKIFFRASTWFIKIAPQSWVNHLLKRSVLRVSSSDLEYHILSSIQAHIVGLAPDEALRFLFRLDEKLYLQQGNLAVAYGGGLHTKHRHMKYHDFFVNRIKSNERVMDIGCGIGALAYSIADISGAKVTGIDINLESIDVAQKRFSHDNIEYIVGDALEYLPDNSVDVVVLSNVLEHIPPERPAFLKRVIEIVHPSRMLIRVPLFERDWRVPLKKELGVEWRLDPTHYIEYTLETFAEEMREAGLEIIHLEVRWGEIWAELLS